MRILAGLLSLGLALPLAACGDDATTSDPSPTPTSGAPADPRLVVEWGEGAWRDQSAWLDAQKEPRLLDGEAAVERFLSGLPEEFAESAAPLQDVDPATEALLVAGFAKCANDGKAVVDGETVSYVVRKTADYVCAWAPIQVQVWAVPTGLSLAR